MTILVYYTSHEILNNSSQDRSKQLPLSINNIFTAYTSSVKNIENSANFIIRNLISSYIKTPIIKVNPEIKDKTPALFTGKPKLPNYHGKNSRCAFTLGKDRFKAKDNIAARVITEENINDFTSIRDKSLDNNKLKVVNADINGSFNMMRKIFPVIEYDTQYHNFNYKIVCMHEHSKNFKFINKNKILTKNMLSLSL